MAAPVFDDIWSHLDEHLICGYCAVEVKPDAATCPGCRRRLYQKTLRYAKPSTPFYIFLLLITGLVQLFMLQVALDLISGVDTPTIIWHGFFMPVFAMLAVFLYLRHFWAYVASLIAVVLAATQIGVTRLTPEMLDHTVLGTPLSALYHGFGLTVAGAIFWLLAGCLTLAFLVGLIWAAPDFARDRVWYWGRSPKDLHRLGATSAHLTGQRFADQGLWAMAIVYWQRAVAADPTRLLYYLQLIDAYRRLAFKERALDMITAAEMIARTPEGQAQLTAMRATVEHLPAAG